MKMERPPSMISDTVIEYTENAVKGYAKLNSINNIRPMESGSVLMFGPQNYIRVEEPPAYFAEALKWQAQPMSRWQKIKSWLPAKMGFKFLVRNSHEVEIAQVVPTGIEIKGSIYAPEVVINHYGEWTHVPS